MATKKRKTKARKTAPRKKAKAKRTVTKTVQRTVTVKRNPKKRKASGGAGGYRVAALIGSAVRYFDGMAINGSRASSAVVPSMASAKSIMTMAAKRFRAMRAAGVFKRSESDQAIRSSLLEAVAAPKKRKTKKARRARTR